MEAVTSLLQFGSPLGAGAFGEVFAATHHVHGPVAVKKVHREAAESDAEWDLRASALVREGKNLKTAEHDCVVRVLDVTTSTTEQAVLLIVELCSGGSLQAAFEKGPMRLDSLRNCLTDVALGMQAVHARGLIHRDLKPGNILLSSGRAKVSDFGLVTDQVVVGYASGQGYLDHLAPEVFKEDKTSIRTDVWAFGMTAYRLLHGQHFYSQLPAPRHLIEAGGFAGGLPWLPHIPSKWRRFVRKAMHDDSASRTRDFGEVLSSLAELPTSAAWECRYAAGAVDWVRVKSRRRLLVEWRWTSPHDHAWTAVSHPAAGAGRSRTLGSGSNLTRKAATRALEKFFAQP